MHRIGNLKALREKLSAMNVSAIIIPTNDPHFGEYTQDHYKVREWLSGFNGSAGTLVVTLKDAALWTDSRYFVQAAAQLQGSGIKLMRMKMEGTPSISQWILQQYPEGELVAIDRSLFSYSEYEALCSDLAPCKVQLIDDIFDGLWEPPEITVSGNSPSSLKHFQCSAYVAYDNLCAPGIFDGMWGS